MYPCKLRANPENPANNQRKASVEYEILTTEMKKLHDFRAAVR